MPGLEVWADWSSVAEGRSTPGAPVMAIPWGNNIALFLADRNGGIYTALGDPNYAADHGNFAGFGPWRSVSEGSSTPGAPVMAAPYGGRVGLFITDPGGGIYGGIIRTAEALPPGRILQKVIHLKP